MSLITTGSHPKSLWPGVKAWFGLEYDKHDQTWKKIFETDSSDKAYEEDVELTGFGLMPTKAEGDAIRYDTASQGFVKRYVNVVYGMGYVCTREEQEDGQYAQVSQRRSTALAFSAQTTKEIVHANILNRAFNTSYLGGDGVRLISTAHVTRDGTQSNELATPADLSEAALEDICIQIMNAKNSRGLNIALKPERLIVAPAGYFDARRILESDGSPGTANNDKNIVKDMFKGGLVTWPFLEDLDAWFVQTNAPRGLMHFNRRAGAFDHDNDYDTENKKAKFTERYAVGWTDWRGLYGSAGA
jgi:hypothetical protein